jgi:hypothetical protein
MTGIGGKRIGSIPAGMKDVLKVGWKELRFR